MDETVFGGQEEGVRDRKNRHKKLVVIGIEKKKKEVARLNARLMPQASSLHLGTFIRTHIHKEASLTTDKWTRYKPLKKEYKNMVQIPSGKKGGNFPEMHRVNMNLKGWLRDIHDLQAYLDEYCYRFNRSFMDGGIFDNLMKRMVNTRVFFELCLRIFILISNRNYNDTRRIRQH